MIPGIRIVDVVQRARVDRAAEDIDEEQHEHDRLDREADQQIGLASNPLHAALRELEGVRERVLDAAHVSSLVLGRTSGQVEEDVVERRRANGDVVDRDPGVVEPPDGVGDRAAALLDRNAERAVLDERPVARDVGQGSDGVLASTPVAEVNLQPVAADLLLEVVRRALGYHEAAVDHRDAIGKPVGLVQVLGGEEHGRPAGHECLHRIPEADAAADVEARRRLVEKEHGRPCNERGRKVEPAPHSS